MENSYLNLKSYELSTRSFHKLNQEDAGLFCQRNENDNRSRKYAGAIKVANQHMGVHNKSRRTLNVVHLKANTAWGRVASNKRIAKLYAKNYSLAAFQSSRQDRWFAAILPGVNVWFIWDARGSNSGQ